MFNSSIIEVVIGLIFVFSLLAILVTQINTIITTTLNLRAKQLKQGLQNLITDKELQAKLLSHPIINMVYADSPQATRLSDEEADAIVNAKETDVTWIDPSAFVEVLMNLLLSQSEETLFQTFESAVESMPTSAEKSRLRELLQSMKRTFSEDTLREVYAIIGNISDENIRRQLKQGVSVIERTISKVNASNGDLVPLLNGVKQVADPKLRSALETIIKTAEDIQDAQVKLENWFNEGMNRASDSFQKNIGRYSLLASFLLALILNIDTVSLGRSLWEDPELRQQVAATATAFDRETALEELGLEPLDQEEATNDNGSDGTTDDTSNTETEANPLQPPEDQIPDDPTFEDINQQIQQGQETTQTLLEMQLPIGWQFTEVTDAMINRSLTLGQPDPRDNLRNLWNFVPGNTSDWLGLWLQKIIGIVITTIAAAQGAPFWFDLLRRLTQGRAAG